MRSPLAVSLLDTASAIHSAGCRAWGDPSGLPSPDAPIETLLPDEVVAYAAGARQLYSDLRRLVGQLAGLLILAQASGRREAFDLPALAGARELWRSLPDRLDELRAPHRLDVNAYRLRSAYTLLGRCLDALQDAQRIEGRPDLTAAMGSLTQAYACLQSASEPRLGMTMVDFSHACCSCAINK